MNAFEKWAKRCVWLVFAAVFTIGCNPLQTVAFIFHKDDKLPAKYPLRPIEGPKKDKDEELVVAILCNRGVRVPQEFAGIHSELASTLAKRLPEAAKENKEKITVIPTSKVDKFKFGNPTWKTMPVATIGKKLGADYVLDITISNVSIYEPGTDHQLYKGTAEANVDLYDVENGPGEPKERYTHALHCPKTGVIARDNMPPSRFKQMFVEQLAQEIIQYHLEHRPSDGIAAER